MTPSQATYIHTHSHAYIQTYRLEVSTPGGSKMTPSQALMLVEGQDLLSIAVWRMYVCMVVCIYICMYIYIYIYIYIYM